MTSNGAMASLPSRIQAGTLLMQPTASPDLPTDDMERLREEDRSWIATTVTASLASQIGAVEAVVENLSKQVVELTKEVGRIGGRLQEADRRESLEVAKPQVVAQPHAVEHDAAPKPWYRPSWLLAAAALVVALAFLALAIGQQNTRQVIDRMGQQQEAQ